jgi:chromosome segregation ATPase
MDGQALVELDKAIEKAENARRKAEDEYALISKFVSDKKYIYENAKKTHDSVRAEYDKCVAEQNRLKALLEQENANLKDIKNAVADALETSRLADTYVQKAMLNAQNTGKADSDMPEKVEKARLRLQKAEEKLSNLQAEAAHKRKDAEAAATSLEDVKNALKTIQNDRLDELLTQIQKGGSEQEKCRQLVEYWLLLKGNVSEIKLSEDNDNNFIRAIYTEKADGADIERTEYFSLSDSGETAVTQKKTAYMKDNAQFILNADGGYCIKTGDRVEKVRTPVIKTQDSYSVAREEKARKLRDRSEDSEYGVRDYLYSYDEKNAVRKVDIINIDGENCNIVEQLTANVDITEKIRENFNISKEAEERKKELEKLGYEATLNQVNSSGYKTYKITAFTNRQEKMLVAQTRYSHLDVYRLKFESENIIISEKDVISGRDSYRKQKSELEEKLAGAKEKVQLSENIFADAEAAVKAASGETEKIKSETADIIKNAEEADLERQKNAAETEQLKNDSALAAKKLKDCEIKEENIKEETERIKIQLETAEKDVEAMTAELSKAQSALDSAQKDLEKAENVCMNGKNTFERADEKLKQLEEEKASLTHSPSGGNGAKQDRKKGRFQDIISAFTK